jgi:hypothetical protein
MVIVKDGIELWTRDQANKVYRRFGQDFTPYEHFVFINYHKVSTKRQPMDTYRQTHDIGVFLVAIDTSDCRHVLCGFRSEAERDKFLAQPSILIDRNEMSGEKLTEETAWRLALEQAKIAVTNCREAGKAFVDDDGQTITVDSPNTTTADDPAVIAVAVCLMSVLFRRGDGASWDDSRFGGAP